MTDHAPTWVPHLVAIPSRLREGGTSVVALFRLADPDLVDRQRTIALIRAELSRSPDTIREWQEYSWDKRSSDTHYLDGHLVGFISAAQGRQEVASHEDPLDACAEFIYLEAARILNYR